MKSILETLQPLGRALMLPIAVLPVAAILLRLGAPDIWDYALPATWAAHVHPVLPFIYAAGNAIFSNLGLLFAIGVAVGLARENHGAAGLAGVVCFLVMTEGAKAIIAVPPSALAGLTGKSIDLAAGAFKADAISKLSVPAGLISGLVAGWLYNRFHAIKLPDYLAFFGGRRFVPIAAGFAGLILAAIFGWGWASLSEGMDALSHAVLGAGNFGLFAYGVLNRLLLVTGLHHIINNIAWFILGDYHGTTGDLKRFFAGDPNAGAFMSGFFPVMMFGLPAACLAMYHAARPERRKAVGGLLLSMALTAFLTGVTEPIEFSFMFLAPALFLLHAVLTGIAMVAMNLLGVKLGFGFSAGLFDYLINFGKATRPLWLLPVGAVYFALYYTVFRAAIRYFDLKTLGREPEGEVIAEAAPFDSGARGPAFVAALGGAKNFRSVDACTTRLRLVVADSRKVDAQRLKALGARGIVKPSANAVQVVLGPIADQVAAEMRAFLAQGGVAVERASAPEMPSVAISSTASFSLQDGKAVLAALGGAANVRDVSVCSSRLRVGVARSETVDEAALKASGARGVVKLGSSVHVVIGPAAAQLAEALRTALA
ncbi:MAG TPA: N-acetylglucosamine-specific PTS transporter subunit IIBC [Rhizomicrobium sp.]|nr:N-acetylglucosamine-specific PTS transporter subunit IIBC [Rhizomicrobium sp.]